MTDNFEIIQKDDRMIATVNGKEIGYAKIYHYASTRGGVSYWKNNVNKSKRFDSKLYALADIFCNWMNTAGGCHDVTIAELLPKNKKGE